MAVDRRMKSAAAAAAAAAATTAAPGVGNMSWVGYGHIKVVSVGATNLAPRRRSAVAECLSRTIESSLAADAMYELRERMWNFRLYAATSGEIEKNLKSFAVPTLPQ